MKLTKIQACGIRQETTQGTAVVPSATDYIVVPNVDISLVSDQLQRDFRRSSLDKLPHVIGKRSVMVKFQTEMKNSGVAGTEYAPLSAAIQACAFVKTVHSGVESVGAAVANSGNHGVSPHPVIIIGTPAFSAKSGKLVLTLLHTTVTNPEDATFEAIFYPGDGSPALTGSVTITDTNFAAQAFDGDLTSLELTVDDPDAGGVGLPVSTWQVGDSWEFAYVSASEVDVTYTPTSAAASGNFYGPGKSVTLEVYKNGLKHIVAGCLGTMKITLESGKFPVIDFEFKGMYQAVTDSAMPTQTFLALLPPVWESSTLSLMGSSLVINKWEIDVANTVTQRDDAASANAIKGFVIVDRDPKGSCDPEGETVAIHDFFGKLVGSTIASSSVTISAGAGKLITISMPKTQYGDVQYGDRGGLQIFNTPLRYSGDAGDDWISIVMS